MSKTFARLFLTALSVLMIVACAGAPTTFVRNQPSGWITIEVAEGLSRDELWGKIADSLKERDLEFEKLDRDAGYMRTSWNFKISPKKIYATRVIIDFPSNAKTVRVKTEAQYQKGDMWIEGYDSSYNATFKDEVTAIVGRK